LEKVPDTFSVPQDSWQPSRLPIQIQVCQGVAQTRQVPNNGGTDVRRTGKQLTVATEGHAADLPRAAAQRRQPRERLRIQSMITPCSEPEAR